MNVEKLYRLELDDYATPAFVSGTKSYFGTLRDVREWISAIEANEDLAPRFEKLSVAYQAYLCGQQNVTHHVAYHDVPFLKPALLLHQEHRVYDHYHWEHTNVWGFPYYMKCDSVEATHMWIRSGRNYCRCIMARFRNLQYKSVVGGWMPFHNNFWGYPEILVTEGLTTRNRLSELEKHFNTIMEVDQDWEAFKNSPEPVFSEFCNDIFGDG